MANNDSLLTPEECARVLNISRAHLYPRLLSGQIPSITIGRSRRIPRQALEAWINQQLSDETSDEGVE